LTYIHISFGSFSRLLNTTKAHALDPVSTNHHLDASIRIQVLFQALLFDSFVLREPVHKNLCLFSGRFLHLQVAFQNLKSYHEMATKLLLF